MKIVNRSFVCNVCTNLNKNEELCKECNGQGKHWEPTCKEKYEENPQEYMKHLILGSL